MYYRVDRDSYFSSFFSSYLFFIFKGWSQISEKSKVCKEAQHQEPNAKQILENQNDLFNLDC